MIQLTDYANKDDGAGAGGYGTNKHDGVYTGEPRTITPVDAAGIPPNRPRPEQVAPTGYGKYPGRGRLGTNQQ